MEEKDPRKYGDEKNVFDWTQRPIVANTTYELSKNNISLKEEFYYTIKIDAFNTKGALLSTTARKLGQPDFYIAK